MVFYLIMGYQTCGYINCCNHSGEYPERIDDVAYRGVVAAPCDGLAPVIPQAHRDVRACVRTKPSSVVVAAPCAGLAPVIPQARRDVRSCVRKRRTSERLSICYVYRRTSTTEYGWVARWCGRSNERPYCQGRFVAAR